MAKKPCTIFENPGQKIKRINKVSFVVLSILYALAGIAGAVLLVLNFVETDLLLAIGGALGCLVGGGILVYATYYILLVLTAIAGIEEKSHHLSTIALSAVKQKQQAKTAKAKANEPTPPTDEEIAMAFIAELEDLLSKYTGIHTDKISDQQYQDFYGRLTKMYKAEKLNITKEQFTDYKNRLYVVYRGPED